MTAGRRMTAHYRQQPCTERIPSSDRHLVWTRPAPSYTRRPRWRRSRTAPPRAPAQTASAAALLWGGMAAIPQRLCPWATLQRRWTLVRVPRSLRRPLARRVHGAAGVVGLVSGGERRGTGINSRWSQRAVVATKQPRLGRTLDSVRARVHRAPAAGGATLGRVKGHRLAPRTTPQRNGSCKAEVHTALHDNSWRCGRVEHSRALCGCVTPSGLGGTTPHKEVTPWTPTDARA